MPGVIISHNVSADNAQRQLNIVSSESNKTEQMLSERQDQRVLDAGVGLHISEETRNYLNALKRNRDTIEDGIDLSEKAETSNEIVQRLSQLSVKAVNEELSPEVRGKIDKEVKQLTAELNRLLYERDFSDKANVEQTESVVEESKNNILAKAKQAMLAQANQTNHGVQALLS